MPDAISQVRGTMQSKSENAMLERMRAKAEAPHKPPPPRDIRAEAEKFHNRMKQEAPPPLTRIMVPDSPGKKVDIYA